MSFLKTVVLSLKDELSNHNNNDCKLEDVKSKLRILSINWRNLSRLVYRIEGTGAKI